MILPRSGQDRLVHADAAAFGGAAGRIALDQVELALVHLAAGAVAQLAGQPAAGEHALALADQGAGLAGDFAGLGGQQRAGDDGPGRLGMLFQVQGDEVADDGVDDALHFRVVQLALGLGLELGLGQADGDHGREALAEILAGGHQVLEDVLFLAVGVERAGQRRAEAGEVRAAVDGVDVVGVAVDVLGVLAAVLEGHLDLDAAGFVLVAEVRRCLHAPPPSRGSEKRMNWVSPSL